MDSPVSTEKYALVLIGDQVACFESTTLNNEQWKATLINGEPWVSLRSHSAHTVGAVLKQLSERRNVRSQLAQVPITVIYEQAAARHLADVSQAFIELQCSSWEVLRYEPMAERIRLAPGELLRPHVGDWLAEHLLVQLGSAQAVAEPVVSPASCLSDFSDLPDVALLQLYLPLLFKNFWSSISPQDLAFMSGSLQIPDVESPYPEPSLEAIAVLRRRFLKLPAEQRSSVLSIAQELTYKLKVRTQLRDLLEVV
ncbi:hypothetical protein D3C77_326150 [compost metagenome]